MAGMEEVTMMMTNKESGGCEEGGGMANALEKRNVSWCYSTHLIWFKLSRQGFAHPLRA